VIIDCRGTVTREDTIVWIVSFRVDGEERDISYFMIRGVSDDR